MIDTLLPLSIFNFEKSSELESWISTVFGGLILIIVIIFTFRAIFYFFEMAYVEYVKKKLFFNHVYLIKRKLTNSQKSILRKNFKFYQKLSIKHKAYFEHRVSEFIRGTDFIGKSIEVTDEMKVVISATLVKLTFGLRDYKIKSVERIIFYPEEFY